LFTVLSPFIYEEPVPPSDLVDREIEIDMLVERAMDARNSRLEGPRRYGKTSLLRAALARCELRGWVPISVNFLGVLTIDDVAERIERAYARQLDGPLKRWYTGMIRTLKPTLSGAPGGVGLSLTPQAQTAALLERLALPLQVHERHGRQCAIAFDEFQDVVRVEGAAATFRSELEQQGSAAAYIFSGSHPGLMRDAFADRRHSFYAQAAAVPLRELSSEALERYISGRFTAGRRDPGAGLGPLLDLAAGHPQRAMQLAHHLYVQTRKDTVASSDDWAAALAATLTEAAEEIYTAWHGFSTTKQRVVGVVATRTIKLNSAESNRRFGLVKSGSGSKQAIDQLERNGHILRTRDTATGWRLVDPLLDLWVRGGRRWPIEAIGG
jgi:uncharacterized protein